MFYYTLAFLYRFDSSLSEFRDFQWLSPHIYTQSSLEQRHHILSCAKSKFTTQQFEEKKKGKFTIIIHNFPFYQSLSVGHRRWLLQVAKINLFRVLVVAVHITPLIKFMCVQWNKIHTHTYICTILYVSCVNK